MALYNPGDVIRYELRQQGLSDSSGIPRPAWCGVDARTNALTVQKQDGEQVSYDPKRLYGVNVFEERSRDFSLGERIQFTSGNRDLGIANRDLGTITALEERSITVRMDGKSGREVTFDPTEFRQLDHGYAVTSHSSQGLTADRVIANIDTESSRSLINDRLAYVAISRAAYDARIYTNNAATLGERLGDRCFEERGSRPQTMCGRRSTASGATTRDRPPCSCGIPIVSRSTATRNTALAAVVQDYVSREDRALIFAPDKAEREELTRLIRADLHEQGRLGETFSANVLTDKLLSDKDAKIAADYEVGDVIRYGSKGSDELGISPNTYRTVTGVDAEKNLITVTGADDSPRVYNPATEWQMRLKATVYSPEERELAEGERIQFTRSESESRYPRRQSCHHRANPRGRRPLRQSRFGSQPAAHPRTGAARRVWLCHRIDETPGCRSRHPEWRGRADNSAARSPLPASRIKLHELTVFTSDGYHPASPDLAAQKEFAGSALAEIPTPEINTPSIEFEAYAIEL